MQLPKTMLPTSNLRENLVKRDDLRELRRLTQAIEKIDKGSYGICDVCGSEIQLARLHALATSSTCVDCAFEPDSSPEGTAS